MDRREEGTSAPMGSNPGQVESFGSLSSEQCHGMESSRNHFCKVLAAVFMSRPPRIVWRLSLLQTSHLRNLPPQCPDSWKIVPG